MRLLRDNLHPQECRTRSCIRQICRDRSIYIFPLLFSLTRWNRRHLAPFPRQVPLTRKPLPILNIWNFGVGSSSYYGELLPSPFGYPQTNRPSQPSSANISLVAHTGSLLFGHNIGPRFRLCSSTLSSPRPGPQKAPARTWVLRVGYQKQDL